MLVNLSTIKQDKLVNYHSFKPIQIESEKIKFQDVNFHIQTLVEEVKQLPKKQRKEYKKIIQTFLVTTSSFTMLPLRSMASTATQTQHLGTTTLPQTAGGMPPELLELLLMLLKISVGAGIILAAILLVANGIGKMFKINGMTQWAKDIIRGLIQILTAVPIVFLIYYVAVLLFGHSGWFVSPF